MRKSNSSHVFFSVLRQRFRDTFVTYSNSIISNRNIQFVFYFWQRLCEKINIYFKFFIVWHSKTNDQIENVNANFKQYLKIYVNFNQNDWYDYFFITKFENNFNKNASNDIESFLIIKNYIFKSNLKLSISIIDEFVQRRKIKNVDKFIVKQKKLKQYLKNEFKWFQIKQKKYVNAHRAFAFEFKINNIIMFDARYIKIMRFNKNFDYKNLNFFKIIRMIDNCVYELKLSLL